MSVNAAIFLSICDPLQAISAIKVENKERHGFKRSKASERKRSLNDRPGGIGYQPYAANHPTEDESDVTVSSWCALLLAVLGFPALTMFIALTRQPGCKYGLAKLIGQLLAKMP